MWCDVWQGHNTCHNYYYNHVTQEKNIEDSEIVI